ncbi:MAG: hypothetical protein R6U96_14760 [Promethearchaeia archaeon]
MSSSRDNINDLNRLEFDQASSKKDKKIKSIDFLKGFSICLIILGHISKIWIDNEWLWVYGSIFIILDVFGPSLFIFLSAMSIIFSLRKKMGFIPKKSVQNSIILRGFITIGLGFVDNLLSVHHVLFPLNLWGWNIFIFYGFSQIISYLALKLSRGVRIGIGIMAIYFTPSIQELLFIGKEIDPIIGFLHYIFISPAPHFPFFPFVALCFFSTAFGEMFFEATLLETDEAYMDTFRTFIKYGVILVLTGIGFTLLGGEMLLTTEDINFYEYPFINLLEIVQNQPYFKVLGLPRFLLRGTSEYLFYCLGMIMIILGISFYWIDIKKKVNPFMNMLSFYGKVSFTLFIIHYISIFLYIRSLNILLFWAVWIGYIGFFGVTLYIWHIFGRGKYTLEWFMRQMKRKTKNNERNKSP